MKYFNSHFDLTSIMNVNVLEEFTLVHLAIKAGLYKTVEYFLDELKFDIDFYWPFAKLTLLHVVAKHRVKSFTTYE